MEAVAFLHWESATPCQSRRVLFEQLGTDYPTGRQIADGRAACAACPVLAECRTHSLARNEQWGMWGGLTAQERRDMRRQSNRARREEAS